MTQLDRVTFQIMFLIMYIPIKNITAMNRKLSTDIKYSYFRDVD